MDEHKDKKSHGFTWGMIVGGAVVLMLTTKRGREILKELTEGGLEGIEDFIDLDKVKALTSEFDDEDRTDELPNDEKKKTVKKRKRFFRKAK